MNEYRLLDARENLSRLPRFCTMRNTVELCGVRSANGRLKQPTLQELHSCLFAAEYASAHDAVADVDACARCYFELDRRGLVTPPLRIPRD